MHLRGPSYEPGALLTELPRETCCRRNCRRRSSALVRETQRDCRPAPAAMARPVMTPRAAGLRRRKTPRGAAFQIIRWLNLRSVVRPRRHSHMQAREPFAGCHYHTAVLVDRGGGWNTLGIFDHHGILALRERSVRHSRLVDALEVRCVRDGIAHPGPARAADNLHADENGPDSHGRTFFRASAGTSYRRTLCRVRYLEATASAIG